MAAGADPANDAGGQAVYVLVMYAVYDQGIGGVFTTPEAAEAHALDMWSRSDGHHLFEVRELLLNQAVELSPLVPGWADAERTREKRERRAAEMSKRGQPIVSRVASPPAAGEGDGS